MSELAFDLDRLFAKIGRLVVENEVLREAFAEALNASESDDKLNAEDTET